MKSVLTSLLTAILSLQKEWGSKEGIQINQGNRVRRTESAYSCQFIYVENKLITICSHANTVKTKIQAKDYATCEWSIAFLGQLSFKYKKEELSLPPLSASTFIQVWQKLCNLCTRLPSRILTLGSHEISSSPKCVTKQFLCTCTRVVNDTWHYLS